MRPYRKKPWQPPLWVLIVALFACPIEANDLVSIYQQAVQEDPQLESARENLASVQENRTQTSAALFQPEIVFTANVNQDSQSIQLGGANAIGFSGNNTFLSLGYALTLTQPILHYDRIIAWQQADRRIAQAEAEFAAAEIALLLRVAERYFDVLTATDNLRFAKAQQDALARGLKEAQQRQAVGFLASNDVQETQSGYDRALADVVDAEHQLRDVQESLQQMTGDHHYGPLLGLRDEIPLVSPDPDNEERWVSQALIQNLDLRVNENLVDIAKKAIEIKKAGHFPTVDATGIEQFSGTGGRYGSADVEDTIVGLSLTVPLYKGGQVNSLVRQAEHLHRVATAKLKQTQRDVHRATSKAFLGVMAGISRVKAFQQALKSSQTMLAGVQASVLSGRRTSFDVIIAERELLRSQKDYARARYDYLLDTLRLKQAVGTLSPNDLLVVNSWLENAPEKKIK